VAYQYYAGYRFSGSTCANVELNIGNPELFIGYRNVSGTSRNHTPTKNEQGGVTLWVRAYDHAGNYSDWSKSVYYYDHEAPTTTINAPTGVVGNEFRVSGEALDNLALNRVYVQLINRDDSKRYGGTTIHLIGTGSSAEWSKTFNANDLNLPDGEYAAHVSVVDMAGNTGAAGWTANFTVDVTAPEISEIADQVVFGQSLDFSPTVTDNMTADDEIVVAWSQMDGPGGAKFDPADRANTSNSSSNRSNPSIQPAGTAAVLAANTNSAIVTTAGTDTDVDADELDNTSTEQMTVLGSSDGRIGDGRVASLTSEMDNGTQGINWT
jgi:hypothetical protein